MLGLNTVPHTGRKAFIEEPFYVYDYRRKHDDVVRWNDFNHPEWYNTTTNSMLSRFTEA